MRPGDRKQRWQSSCIASGMIMLVFAGMVCLAAAGTAGIVIGGLLAIPALFEFLSAKRGWKIHYDLPASYYRDIESPDKDIRDMAHEAAKSTLREAERPDRIKYAFDSRVKRRRRN